MNLLVSVAVVVYKARAELIETVGFVCLVVAAAHEGAAWGWFAIGSLAVAKATVIDRRSPK